MTSVGVDICDTCGKRMPQGKSGNLVLTKLVRFKDSYTRTRNVRNWACCKDCVNKLTGVKTIGDYIRDDIEILIDEYCGKREKKILTKKKIKVKNILEVVSE
jgi:hypothetical protein